MIVPRISFKAIAIAFIAELAADILCQLFLFALFAGDMANSQMTAEEQQAFAQKVIETTALLPWAMVLGMATTVGGAYFAARLAQRIPYYHGLAMGIVGIVYILLMSRGDFDGYTWIGLLLTIPASLFGAHLARKHMPPETEERQ
jgi:nicotinamide riboside transporter PnuC